MVYSSDGENMASDDDDIPETGAIFTFGKTRFAENLANKFWIRDDKVFQLACGDEHSAVITSSGRLYTFGSNDWGQLGHGNTKPYTKPSVLKKLKGDKAKYVACGRSHTLVITESGVFSFGAGADSQLGHGDSKSYNVPTQIESFVDKSVTMVACGAEHSAALTDSGQLYMWGSGSEGQLGLGISECEQPTLLKFRSEVVYVACGYYHTAVITEDGKLFTFGDNEGGKLGLEDHQCYNTEEPQQVKTLQEHVVSVACGGNHTAVLTKRGSLYTFGYGMHGQLGLGPSAQNVPHPRLVSALQRKVVTAVSCGESHTAVVTKSGELYTCGDGRHGKLGMGDESFSNLFKPERVTRFKGFHVDHVACGGCHMLAVAARNEQGFEESEDSGQDLITSTVASCKNAEDVVDGPVMSPRLSATVPLSGLSARDKRRQKDLESSTLGGSLPPLSRSSLPPLASLGLSPLKKEESTKSTLNGSINPLDRSMLPTILLKAPSPEEEDQDCEKKTLNQSANSRRLPLRPKIRRKKPEPASESEEDEDLAKEPRKLETTIRPKPLPRKQKLTIQNKESAQKVQEKKPDAEDKGGSEASDEESEDDDAGEESYGPGETAAGPSSAQSLAEVRKSEKIEEKNQKADDDSEEEEEEEDEEDGASEEEEDGDTESGEKEEKNEKPPKSKGAMQVNKTEKESDTITTVVEEMSRHSEDEDEDEDDENEDENEDEDENENEDKDEDEDEDEDKEGNKDGEEDKQNDNKNKEGKKDEKIGLKKNGKDDEKNKKEKTKDKKKDKTKGKKKEKSNEDEREGGGKGDKLKKSKTKSKEKKKEDKEAMNLNEQEDEDKTEETEKGKEDGEIKETDENVTEGEGNKTNEKGKQKTKKSGICILL